MANIMRGAGKQLPGCPSAGALLGYTLLEMLVVLAIVALATALAAPSGYRMIRVWQEAAQVDEVIDQLQRLPGVVRASGNVLVWNGDADTAPLELPEGWVLTLNPALQVLANGMCAQAQGQLHTARQVIELAIEAPFCRVRRE